MQATRDGWLSATALAAAACLLGQALQLSNGALSTWAMRWVFVTLVLTVVGVVGLTARWGDRWGEHVALTVIGAAITASIAIHLTTAPGIYLRVAPAAFVEHHYLVAVGAVLAGAGISRLPWLGRAALPLLLLVHFLLGLWLLKASPSPFIDVFAWHGEAFRGIRQGIDPYAMSMPNIYGRTDWYAPGIADAARVNVGYPYPPLSLLLAAPGQLLAGDYRYSNLVALTLSGGFIAYARPSRLATAVALVFLFTPRGLFVLEQGWTEANVVFMLAATVFVACRFPKLLPYAFGMLLAVKQYMVLAAPLVLLLLPWPLRWREVALFIGKSVAVAVVLTLPLFLWDPGSFVRSVLIFQSKQPFRADALSFLASTARDGAPVLPMWLGFAMVLVALALGFWRAARTPAGFAASSALVFLLFFAFSKQAFCNYYFMIIGALCIAAASSQVESSANGRFGSTEASPASKVDASTPTAPS